MKLSSFALALALVQSAAAQTSPPWRVVMRIDGASEDINGRALTTVVLPGNRIAFFDNGTAQFVFFDSAAKRLGTFGARGEGPGEFGSPTGRMFNLEVGLIGDTMWVHSQRQRRYTLIGPDMKLVRTFLQPPAVPPVAVYNPLAALAGDRLLARADFGARVPITLPDGRKSSTYKATDSAVVVLAKDGTIERRLLPMPRGSAFAMIVRPNQPIGRTATIPFAQSRLMSHSPDGARVATATVDASAGRFTVSVVRTTGEPVYSRAFPFTPEPVTNRMRDSALERSDSAVNRGANPEENAELAKRVREGLPATVAPFRELHVGSDGTVWLRRAGPPDGPDEYVMIDATGTQLPPFRMPRRNMRLLTGTRTSVWAVETDADGFVSVVRMVR